MKVLISTVILAAFLVTGWLWLTLPSPQGHTLAPDMTAVSAKVPQRVMPAAASS